MSLGIDWIRKEIPYNERLRPCQDSYGSIVPWIFVEENVSGIKIAVHCGHQKSPTEHMAFTKANCGKQLAIAKLKLDDILELSGSEFFEDASLAYNRIGELIKNLEMSKDGTTDCLIDSG